jgi:hypothetical protein
MTSMSSAPKKLEQPESYSAVADSIVDTFLVTLTAEERMEAVAKLLRLTLLENHSYSEASLRSALFDEGTP